MKDSVGYALLVVITGVWVINMVILPVVIDEYTPDTSINGIFAIAAGFVFTARRGSKEDDDKHD